MRSVFTVQTMTRAVFAAPTLVALALCVMPTVANADNVASRSAARYGTRARAHSRLPIVEVQLTMSGLYSTPDDALVPGMTVLDRQVVDVDGDGDNDQLAFVDVQDRTFTAAQRARTGRGAVVFFNEQGRWRGQTIASVDATAIEAAYNWADAPAFVAGRAPVLRVLYSASSAGRIAQAEYSMRFDRDAIRPVHSQTGHAKR